MHSPVHQAQLKLMATAIRTLPGSASAFVHGMAARAFNPLNVGTYRQVNHVVLVTLYCCTAVTQVRGHGAQAKAHRLQAAH